MDIENKNTVNEDTKTDIESSAGSGDVTSEELSNDKTEDACIDNKINEIIKKQMEDFQNNFMENFNNTYQGKLKELKKSQDEIAEKKQHIAVNAELKAAKIDTGLIDFVYDKDIEVSKIKIKQLKDAIETEAQRQRLEYIQENRYIPPKSTDRVDWQSQNFKKPKYMI